MDGNLVNLFSNALLSADGRMFGLDAQLLFELCIQGINILILFTFLSYILFNPVRDLLNKRKEKIKSDREEAQRDKEEAQKFKAEYDEKIKTVDKEAEELLSAARKKALKRENEIIDEAKAEAARIIARANNEIELEKKKVKDELKKEMISIATVMAEKMVAVSIDSAKQDALIEETLKEMGEETWLS